MSNGYVPCYYCGGTGKIKHECTQYNLNLIKLLYGYPGESLGIYRCSTCGQLWKIRWQWDSGTGSDNSHVYEGIVGLAGAGKRALLLAQGLAASKLVGRRRCMNCHLNSGERKVKFRATFSTSYDGWYWPFRGRGFSFRYSA